MMPIVIVVVLWMSLGVSFLTFIAGLQGIDSIYYEAGAIDGVRNLGRSCGTSPCP